MDEIDLKTRIFTTQFILIKAQLEVHYVFTSYTQEKLLLFTLFYKIYNLFMRL